MDLVDFLDFAPICRDDACEIEHLHEAHVIDGRERVFRAKTLHVAPWTRPDPVGLREAVFASVDLRRCKPFREIKFDVLSRYGTVTGRTIQRAIVDLLDQRKIIHVVSPKLARARRATGAYIRMDSPLLWDRDGYVVLLEQLRDCDSRRDSLLT